MEGTADLDDLERRLQLAKQEWEVCAKRHSEVAYRRGRVRKAQQTATELARALSEYEQAWRALEQARNGAGQTDPSVIVEPAPEIQEPQPKVSLSKASFEQLRGLGMSQTQARRVIRYREERGDFQTLDDLSEVPGFPTELVTRVKTLAIP